MRDDSAEVLFQSVLQEALVSCSGLGKDVHSLMLSIQHFLGRPQRRPPSIKVLRRMVENRSSQIPKRHGTLCDVDVRVRLSDDFA